MPGDCTEAMAEAADVEVSWGALTSFLFLNERLQGDVQGYLDTFQMYLAPACLPQSSSLSSHVHMRLHVEV